MDTPTEPPVRWDIVEEHLAEGEFLLERLTDALDSAAYLVEEVRDGPYERLVAHVDGLAVGGAPVATRLLEPTVAGDDADLGTRTAAALGLLASMDPGAAERLLGGYADASEPARAAIGAALCWWDASPATLRLQTMLAKVPGEVSAPLWHACARRGMDPGAPIEAALRSGDLSVATAAAAARYAPRPLQSTVEWALQHDDERRPFAIEAGLVMGSPHAWNLAMDLARDKTASHRVAMAHVASLDGIAATPLLVARLDDAAVRPDALWALGFAGTVEAADACLRWLGDEAVGPLAGEAFAAITGLPPDEEGCWDDPKETEDADDGEDADDTADELPDLDEDLETDLMPNPDDELPCPIPEAIAAWWQPRRGAFKSGQRYIVGRPADGGSLLHALKSESTRRRHERAFELQARTRGACVVPTWRTPTAQILLTRALNLPARIDGNRPYGRIS